MNLINELTCFKNPENPPCIDLILTSRPESFQNSCAIETGLLDFHEITLSLFRNIKLGVIKFRNYRHFQNNAFKEDFLCELPNLNIEIRRATRGRGEGGRGKEGERGGRGEVGRSPLLFFENQKKCPDFRKRDCDCVHPYVKFNI